jgi:predicted nucleotidyltransferase
VSGTSDTRQSTDETALGGVIEFARGVAELWDQHLGERLLGVYLIGSLAHGGYSPRYSDIDMALITLSGLITRDLELVRQKAAIGWPDLAPRLSLFWSDETFSSGRFPPLDRIDYLDHGLPVLERRRLLPQRPTLLQVRSYLSGAPLTNWRRQVLRLTALAELAPDDHKAYLRALLYPARFLYSWETGTVASNDEAVACLDSRAPPGVNVDLIRRALDCRNATQDPSPLFADRLQLLEFVDICASRSGAIPKF